MSSFLRSSWAWLTARPERLPAAFGVLALLAVFVLAPTLQAFHNSPACGYEAHHEDGDSRATLTFREGQSGSYQLQYQAPNEGHAEACTWGHTPEEWIALLTAYLVGFTSALAIATACLWWETREGARRQVQQNAELSRPRFILRGLPELDGHTERSGSPFQNFERLPEKVRFVIWYEDVGRIPAEAIELRFGWHIGEVLPDAPNYTQVIRRPPPLPTNPRGLDPRRAAENFINLTPDQSNAIFDGAQKFWVFSVLEYVGIGPTRYFKYYCGRWAPKSEALLYQANFTEDRTAPVIYWGNQTGDDDERTEQGGGES